MFFYLLVRVFLRETACYLPPPHPNGMIDIFLLSVLTVATSWAQTLGVNMAEVWQMSAEIL